MITLLLLIPIIGSLIILPMSNTIESQSKMKKIALSTSLINFFISLFIWYQFDSSITQYQFVTSLDLNQGSFCHFNFGIDCISLYFVVRRLTGVEPAQLRVTTGSTSCKPTDLP